MYEKKKKEKKKCNVFLRKVINYPSNEISNNRACINISKKKKKKCAKELSIKIGNFVI